MKKALIYLSFLTFFSSCQEEDLPQGLPVCIENKIKEFKNNPAQNPPAQIWQYRYNGKTVYYIPAACCDQYSQLYDENCNLLCSPDGGITGTGDGQCTDFFEKRSNEILIWEAKK